MLVLSEMQTVGEEHAIKSDVGLTKWDKPER
jgi:hypothetical protein